jgi:TatA/E family protein of Tat protein translocase
VGQFSFTHILILIVLGLIFFGPNRLPSLGKSLGKAIRGFKQGLNEIDVDADDIQDDHRITSTKRSNSTSHTHEQKEKTKNT